MPKCSSSSSDSFANFANIVSKVQIPSKPNNKEYVPLTACSSQDWTIDPLDATKLICQNPGTWHILSQYQVGSFIAGESFNYVDGWFMINDFYVDQSSAGCSVSGRFESKILPIALVANFGKGDFIRLGIKTKTEATTVTAGCFFLPISDPRNSLGYDIPSFILTMMKR